MYLCRPIYTLMKNLIFILLSVLTFSAFGQQITNITLQGDTRYTGRGNANEVFIRATIATNSDAPTSQLQSLTLSLSGSTSLADIATLKVYSTATAAFDSRHPESATLLGTTPPSAGDFVCPLNGTLNADTLYLWITVDIAPDAVEGHHVDIALKSVTTDAQTYTVEQSNPAGDREILLARTTVYRPGDYNSVAYRIPAVITAPDGNLIIATDKRKYNDGDLPQDIDILINRSTDGGHTWSEPLTLAQGTGVNHGFGDCALVRTDDHGGMMAAFVGGVGLWNSTATNPQRSYICTSSDNGITWSEPRDITNYVFGANCIYPAHRSWRSSFFGSGNGLRTSTGRIMFVAAIRETSAYSLNNYVIYSDDNGETWQCSGRASVGGDEAKVVELTDGRILMSIRHENHRWYNISEDGGVTWQPSTSTWNDIAAPACNGDIIRYTSVNQGHDRNRLLHTVPYGTERKDVTMYVSYDEGGTWPVSKILVPYSSAYSSACILPDGTIGFYVEETYPGETGYSTVFYNFSLDWLTDGADHYTPVAVTDYQQSHSRLLKIYPVPTSSAVSIEVNGLKKITVFNISGQKIKTINTNGKEICRIDTAHFKPGVYIVKGIDAKGNTSEGKFVVE